MSFHWFNPPKKRCKWLYVWKNTQIFFCHNFLYIHMSISVACVLTLLGQQRSIFCEKKCNSFFSSSHKTFVPLHKFEVKPLESHELHLCLYTFLKIGSCVRCQWRDRNLSDFLKKILIFVLKTNGSLVGCGTTWAWVINDNSFLGELTL